MTKHPVTDMVREGKGDYLVAVEDLEDEIIRLRQELTGNIEGDEPSYYIMDIDIEPHLIDLFRTMITLPCGLIGIVSRDDGGIIAYALSEEFANHICTALRNNND